MEYLVDKADGFKTVDYEQKMNRLVERADPESGEMMSSRSRERLARLETRVLRCTDEIRNLDRFIQAQRIGFQKILKKYRKWTGSPTLPRLTNPFLSPSTSFTHLDLTPLYTSFTTLSSRIRAFSPPLPTTPTLERQARQARRSKAVQAKAGYWNEYDSPSDGGGAEEACTIAVDPEDESFPGWGKVEAAWAYLGEKAAPLRWWTPRSVSGTAGTKGERRPLLGQRGLVGGDDADEAVEGEVDDDSAEIYDADDDDENFPLGYETHYATFPSIATQRLSAQRSHLLLLVLVACYTSTFVLLLISGIAVATGRNKLRAEVDAGVIAGVVAGLGFAGVGAPLVLQRAGYRDPARLPQKPQHSMPPSKKFRCWSHFRTLIDHFIMMAPSAEVEGGKIESGMRTGTEGC
ncbi:hypothetical protein ACLOAV_010770 [Pseudogymnoascus australis]